MLRTSFLYTLKCGIDVWVYFEASDVSSMYLTNPSFSMFSKSGDPMDIMYDRETFADLEDKAHSMIYEGEQSYEAEERCDETSVDYTHSKFGASDT